MVKILFPREVPIVSSLGASRTTLTFASLATTSTSTSRPIQEVASGAITEIELLLIASLATPFQASMIRSASPVLGVLTTTASSEIAFLSDLIRRLPPAPVHRRGWTDQSGRWLYWFFHTSTELFTTTGQSRVGEDNRRCRGGGPVYANVRRAHSDFNYSGPIFLCRTDKCSDPRSVSDECSVLLSGFNFVSRI